jgi:iron complex outermembrane recepter protein
MKKIFIVLIVLFIGNLLNAQYIVRGRITDQDSIPLQGATVFIEELNKGTTADQNGNYELKNIPGGVYRILYSFVGHKQVIQTVSTGSQDIELDQVLRSSFVEADEVVVTGGYNSTQHENAVKIDVLKPGTGNTRLSPNFTETLTRIPGVDMISKGSGVSKPVIRGLSMNDILVLNNGVRFENYQYSSHHPLGIDESGIESIEIIKGPASLLYGSDAIGGVINFIKEKPAPQHSINGDYSVQLFSNSLGLATQAGIKGSSDRVSGGIRAGMKSHSDYLQGGGSFVPNSRFNELSIKSDLGYTGNKATYRLFYDYIRQNLGLVEEEAFDHIKSRGRDCRIFYQQMGSHLVSSQNKFNLGKIKLDVNGSFQNSELIHFGEADIYEIQMRLSTLIYETRLYLPSAANSDYIVGAQVVNQNNKNMNNRETILLPDADVNNYSVFGLLQHTFFKKLRLQTGLRYDYRTIGTESVGSVTEPQTYRMALDKNYGSISGSIGGTFNFNGSLFLRANFASAYRTPNLAELTSNGQHETRYEVGDQALMPEKSYETDVSLHYHGEHFTFEISGFLNRIHDYIFISPTGDTSYNGIAVYRYKQSNSRLAGMEAGIHYHPVNISWMHIQSSYSKVTGIQDNGDYLPFVPADKLKFEIRLDKEELAFLKNAYFLVNTETAFNQLKAAPDETTTKGYTLTDCTAGGNLPAGKNTIAVTVSTTNIFDIKYTDHLSTLKEAGMYNPGRNFILSVRMFFGKSNT